MNIDRKVVEQALEALEKTQDEGYNLPGTAIREAIAAIRKALAEQPAQQEPVRLRRGNILRCIETDELCTVWSTSTTGKTLVKWNANEFGDYTAEQIGELFWLEPEPDDLELAAEKSDNYASFHAGYRFAVAHSLAEQPAQQEPVTNYCKECLTYNGHHEGCSHYTTPPAQQEHVIDCPRCGHCCPQS